jgi:hypothetical protein
MSAILGDLAPDPTGAAAGIAYMLAAMVMGFVLSRLAIHAWMSRTRRRPRVFSPNPVSVMIGMLSVPIVLFIYLMGTGPSATTAAALLFTGLLTGPIVFVLAPMSVIYAYTAARGAAISDRSIYVASLLSFLAQVFWVVMFLGPAE